MDETAKRAPMTRARRQLVGVLVVLFAAMLLYKVLHAGDLEQTALFYVGLPAFIALAVAVGARPKSVTGTALAAVTVGLALAGPLLDEGIICLVMAAPLFYLLAVIIAAPVDLARRRARKGQGGRTHAFATVPLIALLALEGTGAYELPWTGPPPSPAPSRRAPRSSSGPSPRRPLRGARAGVPADPLPRPRHSEGTGLGVGAHREIAFNPHRSLGIGSQPTPRSMRLVVAAHTRATSASSSPTTPRSPAGSTWDRPR
ncbi:hypothetical protein O1L44_00905 [Streptomyces noursei]|nr:hypothetical protein [Streptomyces noursei]